MMLVELIVDAYKRTKRISRENTTELGMAMHFAKRLEK